MRGETLWREAALAWEAAKMERLTSDIRALREQRRKLAHRLSCRSYWQRRWKNRESTR